MSTLHRNASIGFDFPASLHGVGWTLGLIVMSLVVTVPPAVSELLEYDRGALLDGSGWRALTGHLPHYSWSHWLWNALAFGILGAHCERRNRRSFALALFLSALAIPAALCVFAPELSHYRGLSGVTSALFGLLAVRVIVDQWRLGHRLPAGLTAALCLGFIATLARTWVANETLLITGYGSEVMPVPVAHAIGLVIGVGLALPVPETCRKAGQRPEAGRRSSRRLFRVVRIEYEG